MGINVCDPSEAFVERHIGPRPAEWQQMLDVLGYESVSEFLTDVIPSDLQLQGGFRCGQFVEPRSEQDAIADLRAVAKRNELRRSFIGQGYYGTWTPPVIARNILENPGWYTQYTPYQPEISQGRLEALLVFQTMVASLTNLPVANASLLDEGTAAAEALALSLSVARRHRRLAKTYLVASDCFEQTKAVVLTRGAALGVKVEIVPLEKFYFNEEVFGCLVQYPSAGGDIHDCRSLTQEAQTAGAVMAVATDLLSLLLLEPPGSWGADIVVGSTQRFGVPLGYGGPHAAFCAVRSAFERFLPGRLVGVSRDAAGQRAYRLALQTREQHIRREKATSNICTAQVLLAIMAGMYAVYHGPARLRQIAERVHRLTGRLRCALEAEGCVIKNKTCFDTLTLRLPLSDQSELFQRAEHRRINPGLLLGEELRISLDETSREQDLYDLLEVITGKRPQVLEDNQAELIPANLRRTNSPLLEQVFQCYHSETEFLRYIRRLEAQDLSLATAMIPLGSCTMKLNPTAAMLPISWPEFADLHPFVPIEQAAGSQQLFTDLELALAEATGLAAVSLQPNAGSQGEFTGQLLIRAYHIERGEPQRRICLIPQSAHGTNPASAVMAGFEVVPVACDTLGNIDLADLQAKAQEHRAELAALMVTYPSTHGVFESHIKEVCAIVHKAGGQVYLDGANLNALIGLVRPADLGVDVMHMNLHKTFAIPHGGGGPGVGPIAVASHLKEFLPGHPLIGCGGIAAIGPVSSAPWGSAGILPISWMYLALMGAGGLKAATAGAILAANYVAERLNSYFPVLHRGPNGRVAHECILDLRSLKALGVEVEDVSKRLMDYGFHAPTVSFPVPGTLMVEPTESESLVELDRFCEAMIAIRAEIAAVERGEIALSESPLKQAPHTAQMLVQEPWPYHYTREQAVYPSQWTKTYKFWPTVRRIDSAYGDRNLVCCWEP